MAVWVGAIAALATAAFAAPATEPVPASAVTLRQMRVLPQGATTKIVLELDGQAAFVWGELHHPERIFFDLKNTEPAGPKLRTIEAAGLVEKVRMALTQRHTTRVVVDLAEAAEFETTQMVNPARLVIEVRRAGTAKPRAAEETPRVSEVRPQETPLKNSKPRKVALKQFVPPPVRPLPKTPLIAPPAIAVAKPSQAALLASLQPPLGWTMPHATPPSKNRKAPAVAAVKKEKPSAKKPRPELAKVETARLSEESHNEAEEPSSIGEPARGADTLTRALGLKLRRVVLDAGHGGKDVGTISPHGLYEKDLVLDVTRRLGELIEERLGSQVVYTRDDDTFVPLQERTAIANREKADLFLSIHANSSRAESVAGFETYYLNFSGAKADMDVASRENASSEKTIADLSDLVKQITLNEKLDESREFAGHLHDATYALSLKTNGKIHDRGIKKAPFMVLIGARMPSVLVEIGFLTNPAEEGQMKKAEYRQKIAEALFKGISGYVQTLSHFQVASGAQAAALEAGH